MNSGGGGGEINDDQFLGIEGGDGDVKRKFWKRKSFMRSYKTELNLVPTGQSDYDLNNHLNVSDSEDDDGHSNDNASDRIEAPDAYGVNRRRKNMRI